MEMMRVNGPDGLVVNVPRDTSPEKINEIMSAIYAERVQARKEPTSQVMRDVVGRVGAGQGLMLGYGDEIEAFARSKLGGENYDDALTDARAKIRAAQQERPTASGVAELTGSLAPVAASVASGFLSGGASAPAAAPAVARTSSLIGNILSGGARGAGIGGSMGVIEGFGKGEGGFENRAASALKDGAVGTVVGGGLGSILPLAGATFRGLTSPANVRAQDRMLDILGEQRLTPQALAAQYTQRQGGGQKPEIPADLFPGSSVAGETRRVLNTPGADRNAITQQLIDRMDDQGRRISGAFEQASGENRKFFAVLDDLEAQRRVDARPLYEAAYAKPARTKLMDDLLTRAPDDVFDEARRAARYDGLDFPDLVAKDRAGARAVAFDYSVKDIDMVKRGLDRVIERETDALTGKVSSEGRRAVGLKAAMVNEADRLAPEYAQARSAWAGPSAVMDAMNKGKRLFDERAEITARDIARLGTSEKEGFLIGALDAVNQRLGRRVEGEDLTRAFRSGNAKQQIEAAMAATGRAPAEAKTIAQALFSDIEREAAMAQTNRSMRSISQTMPLMAQDAAFRDGMRTGTGVLNDLRQGGVSGAIGGAMQRGADRLALGLGDRTAQNTNAELARYLFANNPGQVGSAMAELQRRALEKGRYAPQRAVIPGLLADPMTDPFMQ